MTEMELTLPRRAVAGVLMVFLCFTVLSVFLHRFDLFWGGVLGCSAGVLYQYLLIRRLNKAATMEPRMGILYVATGWLSRLILAASVLVIAVKLEQVDALAAGVCFLTALCLIYAEFIRKSLQNGGPRIL